MLKVIPDQDSINKASVMLSAMGNAKRLQVLSLISKKEIAVGALAVMVDLNQSALSQHLTKLRRAGVVTARRDAQSIYYSCKVPAVLAILKVLEEMAAAGQTEVRARRKAKAAG
jgi:DNA-binding transcriptional ArsR family regulator